jgi:peptidoglycan hydrolase-like protein with peptidoglycan-binding domain
MYISQNIRRNIIAPMEIKAIISIFTFTLLSASIPHVALAVACAPQLEILSPARYGQRSDGVRKIQQALTQSGYGVLPTTGYFGPSTRKAVLSLHQALFPAALPVHQKRHGEFDQGTIETWRSACSARKDVVPELRVVASMQQPAPLALPSGVSGIVFTSVDLSALYGDVHITALAIQAAGLASSNVFESVSVQDQSGAIGDERGIGSNRLARIPVDIRIASGSSLTLVLIGNMSGDLDQFAGQLPELHLVSIESSVSSLSAFPIRGVAHSLNPTLPIGRVYTERSTLDPGIERTLYAGDTGYRFSGIKLTAGSVEDVMLYQIAWERGGTAASDDLKNVQAFIGSQECPIEIEEREYLVVCESPVLIKKGESVDTWIQGDIGYFGAKRTVSFSIGGSDDIDVVGAAYGFSVPVSPQNHTATDGGSMFLTEDGTPDTESLDPFYSGSKVVIENVSVSIGR